MAVTREKQLNFMGVELTAVVNARRAGRLQLRGVTPAPSTADARTAEIQERIAGIPWYHTIDLGHGVISPGIVDNRAEVASSRLPDDLTGKRCLDVGTFDGFWAFEMERRGATVVALDLESLEDMDFPLRRRQERAQQAMDVRGTQQIGQAFNVAQEILGSQVRREILSVYDLAPERLGLFDLVLLGDIIVHLRDPELALERARSVTNPGGCVLVHSAVTPELERSEAPLLQYVGARNHYWVWWNYSARALMMMMEDAGFEPVEQVSRMLVENRAGRFVKVMLRGVVGK
jgi:tRNA (mo5U34)-methyltransferase